MLNNHSFEQLSFFQTNTRRPNYDIYISTRTKLDPSHHPQVTRNLPRLCSCWPCHALTLRHLVWNWRWHGTLVVSGTGGNESSLPLLRRFVLLGGFFCTQIPPLEAFGKKIDSITTWQPSKSGLDNAISGSRCKPNDRCFFKKGKSRGKELEIKIEKRLVEGASC